MDLIKRIAELENELTALRARLYSHEILSDGATPHLVQARVGEHMFGIMLHDLVEVVRMVALEAVPDAPPEVEGLVNLRGHLVTVLNAGTALLGQRQRPTVSCSIAILSVLGRQLGLIVDEIMGLSRLDSGELLPVSAVRALADHKGGLRYVQAALRQPHLTLLILKADALLDPAGHAPEAA